MNNLLVEGREGQVEEIRLEGRKDELEEGETGWREGKIRFG